VIFHYPVLAFDTCGDTGSVALADLGNAANSVTCIGQKELSGRAASAQLMPAIQTLLGDSALDLRAVRALVVVNGPGSFTGIRVGLSTAKGLAHAAGMPIVAVSRLFVLSSLSNAQGNYLAVLDAGRNEFYARREEREWLASFEEIAAAAEAGTPLVMAEQNAFKRFADWRPEQVGRLDASAAAWAALPRVRAEMREDLATLDANYLRRSDAELFARPAGRAAQ
jgi:tRNA threonylcarbamoyladenosine biosynthesis protein TsaB